jgi:hypothetical protein
LQYGLQLASGSGANWVKVAVGTYTLSASLSLKDSITVEGGYLPGQNWAKTNAQASQIVRNQTNLELSPLRAVALSGVGLRNFRLQDLTIQVLDATQIGVSNYGLYLNNCRDYVIARVKMNIGNGGPGQNGTNGTNGANGAIGLNGQVGCWACPPTGPHNNAGGAGGSSWSGGTAAGGTGGAGGNTGSGTDCDFLFISCPSGDLCHPSQAFAPAGSNGTNGSSPGGGIVAGNGGVGRQGQYLCDGNSSGPSDYASFFNGCEALQDSAIRFGEPGQSGQDGTHGTHGTHGVATFAAGFFNPQDGTDGTDGLSGAGGGGGGGGGSLGGLPRFGTLGNAGWPIIPQLGGSSEPNSSGGGGGGGGEGGG